MLHVSGKLFSQRGYYGVSMRDIAEEMNFTKAALYYHFKSKDQLVEKLMSNSFSELKQELSNAVKNSKLPSSVLFNIIKTLLDFKINHPEICLLMSLGVSTDKKIPVLQLATKLRIELMKFVRGLIKGANLTKKFTYRRLLVLTTTLVGFILSPLNQEKNSDELADDFVKLLFPDSDAIAKTRQLI